MEQNKTGKYFKYAIGEIILVVIGILIALSINNKNEERKAAENTMHLFKEVHKELEFNIKSVEVVIKRYRNKDSLAYKVTNKKVSREEYRLNARKYLNLLIVGRAANISDEAYQNLINKKGNTSQVQDSLILKLRLLHGVNRNELDMMDSKIGDYIFELIEKQKIEQEWYYEFYNFNTVTKAMLDYFLLDPAYLNEVTYYKIAWLGEHATDNYEFRDDAIKIYEELSDYLNIPKDSSIIKNANNFEHYIGTYSNIEDSKTIQKIIKRNNQLIWRREDKIDSTLFAEDNFYPDSKTYFTIGDMLGKLLFDKNNEVVGFVRSAGLSRLEYKKIK